MKQGIQKHTGTFTYGHKKILFYFWAHAATDAPIDTIIFLGSGQSGRIPRWIAENAPAGTVVVDGLPHREAEHDAHDLKDFSREYTTCALRAVLKTFNIASLHVVALSQAAPGAIWMAEKLQGQVRNIALVMPLGFTREVLGDSSEERLKELKKRAFWTSLQLSQSPLYDLRNVYLGLMLLHVLLFDSKWTASGPKYAKGSSYDLRQEYHDLAATQQRKGCSLTLLVGEKDKIFPGHEILASLQKINAGHLPVVTLAGTSHSSLVTRGDKKTLGHIIAVARQHVSAKDA
jgi:pimeloyl-ACP methyl ester carboxylesterase